jgi:hypothetical protein
MSSVTAGTIAPWAKGVEYARIRALTAGRRTHGMVHFGLCRDLPATVPRERETHCPRPTPEQGDEISRLSREEGRL